MELACNTRIMPGYDGFDVIISHVALDVCKLLLLDAYMEL